MKKLMAAVGTVVLVGGGAVFLPFSGAGAAVTTTTIDFEIPTGDAGFIDANQYTAQGITITDAFGIVEGVSQGDPGGWGLEGPDGPQFLGQNDPTSILVDFAQPISTFSIQCSRSAGSSPDQTMTATAYDSESVVVDEMTVTVGEINTWSLLSLAGTDIATVELSGAGDGFSPWGCDAMVLGQETVDPTTTTTPSTTTPAPAVEAVAVTPAFTG
jgi:hypothetical protein